MASLASSRRSRRYLFLAIVAVAVVHSVGLLLTRVAFSVSTQTRRSFRDRSNGVRRRALAPSSTWKELKDALPTQSSADTKPVLTLYRDTNGWCPFCERVWLGLREKGIPYDEVLINLYKKPEWYTDMVPTKMVPAIKIASSGDVVWESDAILKRLDAEFPDTKKLFPDQDQVDKAVAFTNDVMNASMGITYSVKNLTDADIDERRKKLVAKIDALDGHLEGSGPYLCGDQLTAADCMAIPMLERFGVQMPYTAVGFEIRDSDRWPSVARWYEAMDANPAYSNRVKGDEYSWTAVAPVMMKLFGGQNGTLTGAAAERADAAELAAKSMLAAEGTLSSDVPISQADRVEAAAKILSNNKAVVADATLREPTSQKDLVRLQPEKASTVDAVLRSVANALMVDQKGAVPDLDADGQPVDAADVAVACRYLAARLCAPRDMSAPACSAFRKVLFQMALSAESSSQTTSIADVL